MPAWLLELAERFPKVSTLTLYLCPECKDAQFVPAGREYRKCAVDYCNGTMLEPLLDFDVLTKNIRDMDGNTIKTRKGVKEPDWSRD